MDPGAVVMCGALAWLISPVVPGRSPADAIGERMSFVLNQYSARKSRGPLGSTAGGSPGDQLAALVTKVNRAMEIFGVAIMIPVDLYIEASITVGLGPVAAVGHIMRGVATTIDHNISSTFRAEDDSLISNIRRSIDAANRRRAIDIGHLLPANSTLLSRQLVGLHNVLKSAVKLEDTRGSIAKFKDLIAKINDPSENADTDASDGRPSSRTFGRSNRVVPAASSRPPTRTLARRNAPAENPLWRFGGSKKNARAPKWVPTELRVAHMGSVRKLWRSASDPSALAVKRLVKGADGTRKARFELFSRGRGRGEPAR